MRENWFVRWGGGIGLFTFILLVLYCAPWASETFAVLWVAGWVVWATIRILKKKGNSHA